ncbi:MAG: hypothetical protein E7678_06635 [Ruminococcaceae bacterium]|nr:hypothetical protein [Oscillospiraceae bacterium]
MLKRFFLILLSILLIIGCCSCNSNTSKETDPISESETEDNTPADKVVISGETRFRIVYAKDANPAAAKKIYNRLKVLDKNAITDDYYTLTTDETPEDNTPEILVGLTNRAASEKAKSELPTYLDYSITVADKKIVIFANTDERLSDATKYFAEHLVKTDSGMIYYPTSESYVNAYDKYELASLKIAGTAIDKFSIIIPASSTESEKEVASTLQLWISEKSGKTLKIKADTETASANEIIIGKTSRAESAAFTDAFAKDVYYSTSLEGTKILIYAGTYGSLFAAANAFKEKALELKGDITELSANKAPSLMKNKKAIFIGNSFIYWGGGVTFIKNHEINEPLRAAGGDKGYFNEVCKANGINMDVYNYTYGGQNLDWIYENKLKNKDKEFLDSFDYVFISEAGQNQSTFMATVDKVAALFPNAEEVVYLAHENTFSSNATHIINALPKLAQKGIKVVAWGELVRDIYTSKIAVPGATLTYNKNSFVKNSTGTMSDEAAVVRTNNDGDSFHQNPLAGYITAQMCFSAITGSLCEGQEYKFCWDKTIAPQYDFDNFVEHQYNNGQTTNFVEIFNSPADMLGIQKLMDQYMNKYN